MAKLVYYHSTMDSGKSTLALQINYNKQSMGLRGLIFTKNDRAGEGTLSSRIGLSSPALEVHPETDLHATVLAHLMSAEKVQYVICDEAQFYSPEQIEQLARVVDNLGIDVFAFGILADFRTKLFPGSARLVELADEIEALQLNAICWCGQKATSNARTLNGFMVTEGEQVVVGDTEEGNASVIAYEVLCRKHYMNRKTATTQKKKG